MGELSIHEVRGSGHTQYEYRRTLDDWEIRAVLQYASDNGISFSDALKAYCDEIQKIVNHEITKRFEADILRGLEDLGEGNRAPYKVSKEFRPLGMECNFRKEKRNDQT